MRDRLIGLAPIVLAYVLVGVLGAFALHWYTVVWVAGGSMVPALVPGDIVVVEKGAAVRAGDIALLGPDADLVLHRVTRVETEGTVWTRGDANPVADLNPCLPGAVRGRVVRIVPSGAVLERWRQDKSCATLPAQSDSARR